MVIQKSLSKFHSHLPKMLHFIGVKGDVQVEFEKSSDMLSVAQAMSQVMVHSRQPVICANLLPDHPNQYIPVLDVLCSSRMFHDVVKKGNRKRMYFDAKSACAFHITLIGRCNRLITDSDDHRRGALRNDCGHGKLKRNCDICNGCFLFRCVGRPL